MYSSEQHLMRLFPWKLGFVFKGSGTYSSIISLFCLVMINLLLRRKLHIINLVNKYYSVTCMSHKPFNQSPIVWHLD